LAWVLLPDWKFIIFDSLSYGVLVFYSFLSDEAVGF